MKTLDKIDYRILGLLQQDAKFTIKEIASRMGMTTTPVYERIKRMEESGYIRQYVALLDADMLNLKLVAYCTVSLQEVRQEFLSSFEEEVQSLPEVIECYQMAGAYGYLLKVLVKDTNHFQQFVSNKLGQIEHIHKVDSAFVISNVKSSTAIPLNGQS